MFQQEAENEGVQPNHNNNMPNSISKELIKGLPSNLGGSAHQSPLFYTLNSSFEDDDADDDDDEDEEEAASVSRSSQLNSSSKQPQLSQPQSAAPSSNQGGSAPQPQLSEAQFLANELWRGLVQPNVNRGGWLSPTQSLGVQPYVNPAQSTESLGVQLYVNSRQSTESLGVQSQDVNSGGRSSLRQSEDQFDIRTADGLNHYRPLYLAAQRGEWKAARCFIYKDPNALTAKITPLTGKTVLHVAACCWQWEFVLKLLEHITSPQSIAVKTERGKTVLHYVAQGGSLKTAKALVKKNSDLLQIKDDDDYLPLFDSISSGNKKLVWYLSLNTTYESSSDGSFSKILRYLIISGYHDIVLYFVKKYSHLATKKDDRGGSLLYWLARNPSSFLSGSNLGFLERWIYKFVHVDIRNSQSHYTEESISKGITTLEPRSFATQVANVEKVRDTKLKHEYAVELVDRVCKQLSSMSFQEMMDFLLEPKDIMASAVRDGIEEIVRALFLQFPDLIDALLMPDLIDDRLMLERTILQTAIKYRQVKIVNIIKEILPSLQLATTKSERANVMHSEKNTSQSATTNPTLQLAGELAPLSKLHSVSGAAFQMQRELQWFKEVKEIEFPILWDVKNEYGETTKDVFRRAHKELAKEGEKWMKDTANSCMLVSALIATVLFAAAFTVPGGNTNDDKGIPIFLRTNAFTIFAISYALGLFSSLTSLLMFLAIITTRYEVEDFLKSLPKKLIIGLGSLFVSIAAMIIAFGAALTIALNERWNWVFVPITLLASFPVAIFVMLQLPLFVQMVRSTYGASIFRPSRKFE